MYHQLSHWSLCSFPTYCIDEFRESLKIKCMTQPNAPPPQKKPYSSFDYPEDGGFTFIRNVVNKV